MSLTSLALFAMLSAGADVSEPTLERALLQQSKEIIKHCEAKSYQNVAVLKFQVTKDDKNLSNNVGTLNMLLAKRLEVALVLNNNARKPIGIVDNASAVAQRTKGANHLSKEGRQKLFEASYPLAWGDTEVKADAFITGLASVSDDLKTLTIQLLIFDKDDDGLQPLLKPFTAANQPEQLAEMGESFNTRGLFDNGEIDAKKREKALHSAALLKNQTKDGQLAPVNPVQDDKAPVTLEVRYDGSVIPLEVRGGKAYVPEPREGQKVVLAVKRNNNQERYGIVLKVNGENTIERQRLPDLQCRFWVLEPSTAVLNVDGYLKANNKEYEVFRVLSTHESKAREMDYGADVGTITLTVFREWQGKRKTPDIDEDAKQARIIYKGTLETKPQEGEPVKPGNFGALTARLLEDSKRGIIAEGPTRPGTVNIVKFVPDSLPVMCLTVVYYNPSNLPK